MDGERELGTLEHWEQAYSTERQNFRDFGDEGEIWFGEDVSERLLDWLTTLLPRRFDQHHAVRILDVGCGNGHFLMELGQRGYQSLHGTDYSTNSIALCESIAARRGMHHVIFNIDTILDTHLSDQFDVVHDKGTFDAISLGANSGEKRESYTKSVHGLMKEGGMFVITSCNETVAELLEAFSPFFSYIDHVKDYPSFTFGGEQGTMVSSVAFERRRPPVGDNRHGLACLANIVIRFCGVTSSLFNGFDNRSSVYHKSPAGSGAIRNEGCRFLESSYHPKRFDFENNKERLWNSHWRRR